MSIKLSKVLLASLSLVMVACGNSATTETKDESAATSQVESKETGTSTEVGTKDVTLTATEILEKSREAIKKKNFYKTVTVSTDLGDDGKTYQTESISSHDIAQRITYTSTKGQIKMPGIDEPMDRDEEGYMAVSDDGTKLNLYSKEAGKDWEKMVMNLGDDSETEASDGGEESGVKLDLEPKDDPIEVFEDENLKVQEKTEIKGGREAYVLISEDATTVEEQGFESSSSIKTYVDAENFLLLGTEMVFDYAETEYSAASNSKMVTTYSYDDVEKPVIPQEALDAPEKNFEELWQDVTDFLELNIDGEVKN